MMRMTHTLLSAFDWVFKKDDGIEDFRQTLARVKSPPTDAMLDGIQFEGLVSEWNKGNQVDEGHEWYGGVKRAAEILQGSAEQVYEEKPITVDGIDYLLVGVADNIKAGIVYDTKMSRRYEFGKYADSSQHPAYFYLFPGAVCFKYLIFNGKDLYIERYLPFDTPHISQFITLFSRFIRKHPDLQELYINNWEAK